MDLNSNRTPFSVLTTILWRFIVFPGHEFCCLSQQNSDWHLNGIAVFSYEQAPCQLSYTVVSDASWHTLRVMVEGWVGQKRIDIRIQKDQDLRWFLNEVEAAEVNGCTDIDLNFSPSTNTLPIRRLNLAVGESADVRAAWLRFPGFTFEPLEQSYHRLEPMIYRYESAAGRFKADLRTNAAGFVTDYPGIWVAESSFD